MSLGSKELDTKTGKGRRGLWEPLRPFDSQTNTGATKEVPPMSISQPPIGHQFHNESLLQNALTTLLQAGAVPGGDFTLWVAPRMNCGRVVAPEETVCTECG